MPLKKFKEKLEIKAKSSVRGQKTQNSMKHSKISGLKKQLRRVSIICASGLVKLFKFPANKTMAFVLKTAGATIITTEVQELTTSVKEASKAVILDETQATDAEISTIKAIASETKSTVVSLETRVDKTMRTAKLRLTTKFYTGT